jgi:hypothetical protein
VHKTGRKTNILHFCLMILKKVIWRLKDNGIIIVAILDIFVWWILEISLQV